MMEADGAILWPGNGGAAQSKPRRGFRIAAMAADDAQPADRRSPARAGAAAPVPTDLPLAEQTDEELLRRHRGGGGDGPFPVLVERYRGELFHFLLRFTNSRAAADDLFQETFLQVHISAESFDVSKRFKPWLFTIAANKARDYLRRARRQKTVPLSASVDGSGGGGASSGGGTSFVDLMEADLPLPDAVTADAEIAELVRGVVAELPEHLREVLLLAYFQKLAYRDIAEMLGVPLGTVKSRLHAAVGTFAQLWKARFGANHGDDEA
jgi:RNA polymerase sigma-70 factor, ECF subfamily